MSQLELDKLIVLHLADLEDANRRTLALQERVGKEMDSLSAKCAQESRWNGSFDWNDDSIWLAPLEWERADTEDAPYAYFSLDVRHGSIGPSGEVSEYWLSTLCGAAYGEYGFRFEQDVFRSKKKWNKILDEFMEDNESKLLEAGFTVDDQPSIFLPVRIDAVALAEAVSDGQPAAALEPFQQALDTLIKSRSLFDELVDTLKAQADA